jgi:hypothetical protein
LYDAGLGAESEYMDWETDVALNTLDADESVR